MKIQTEKYRHQVRELSRVLYDFYAKRSQPEEIRFQSLETKIVTHKGRAA
jgi:hypothetical protein